LNFEDKKTSTFFFVGSIKQAQNDSGCTVESLKKVNTKQIFFKF
jgi:hypothetical protein